MPDEGESLLAFLDGELYRSKRAQGAGDADQLSEAIEHWLSLDQPEDGSIATALGQARYVAMPLTGTGGATGARGSALFVVANFPAFEREEIDDAVQTGAFTQLVTLVLASLLGLVLAGRVLRPLRSLADTARLISETDLRQRIPVRGEDEASIVAGAFNDVIDRLEDAFAIQPRFLDDASHELRTPLTIIRGHVELLELDHDPVERRGAAEVITDEIDRMDRIVHDLLLHDIVVLADPQRLAQATVALADNARRHTKEGDVIRLGAASDAGRRARLWVHDSGTGVADQDIDRIFERFEAPAAPATVGPASGCPSSGPSPKPTAGPPGWSPIPARVPGSKSRSPTKAAERGATSTE